MSIHIGSVKIAHLQWYHRFIIFFLFIHKFKFHSTDSKICAIYSKVY